MATFEQALYTLWPSGDDKIPGLRAAMVASASEILEKYTINTKTAFMQFMAQISHECGAGLEVEENLSYSAGRMTQVWPSRFHNLAEAQPYAHNPRALANKVYNGRMGNAINSDDGYNFRGRGATQVTGRDGYGKLGQKVGLDLLSNPGLVNSPQYFLECGAADFVLCGCLMPALADDIVQVTRRLNGGEIGLDQRKEWLDRWRAMTVALPIASPIKKPPIVVPSEPTVIPPPVAKNWLQILIDLVISLFKGGK